jgi:hypothetical protein
MVIFVTRLSETGSLPKPIGPNNGNYNSFLSTQLYPNNVFKLPNCCSIALTVMWFSKQQAPCWYWLLIAVQNAGIAPPICCAVTSRYFLVKNTKSITELEKLKIKKGKLVHLYNESNFLWRKIEQIFDGNMMKCLFLILAFWLPDSHWFANSWWTSFPKILSWKSYTHPTSTKFIGGPERKLIWCFVII